MKVLLIGYGSIGKRHYSVLKEIDQNFNIDIVTKQNLERIVTFQNIQEVPDLNSYDYFVIANETYKHKGILDYLDSKVENKVIFCEKPLFDKHYVVTYKNIIFIGYVLRYHPLFDVLRNLLVNQKTISVNVVCGSYLPNWRPNSNYAISYSASKEHGGGVLLDLSHEIDYVIWLFGSFVNVKSICGKYSNLDITSEDVAFIFAKTEKGTIVNMSIDYITKVPERLITVNTNEFTVKLDLIKNEIRAFDISGLLVLDKRIDSLDRNDLFKNMHNEILKRVSEKNCNFDQAVCIMKIIDKLKLENKLYE